LKTLQETFIPRDGHAGAREPRTEDRTKWGQRYVKAVDVLRQAGMDVVPEEKGKDRYIEPRKCWDADVKKLAAYMAWPIEEVDPATPR
jgi:hypothetical protein